MKKAQVQVGGLYIAKVSGQRVTVRIDRESPYGGWDGTNVATGRTIRVRTAARLHGPARIKEDDMVKKKSVKGATKVAESAAEARADAVEALDGLSPEARAAAVEAISDAGMATEPEAKPEAALVPIEEAAVTEVVKTAAGPVEVLAQGGATAPAGLEKAAECSGCGRKDGPGKLDVCGDCQRTFCEDCWGGDDPRFCGKCQDDHVAATAEAAAAPEASDPLTKEDLEWALKTLGFERTGKTTEEIRPRVLLLAGETWKKAKSDAERAEAASVLARAGWFTAPEPGTAAEKAPSTYEVEHAGKTVRVTVPEDEDAAGDTIHISKSGGSPDAICGATTGKVADNPESENWPTTCPACKKAWDERAGANRLAELKATVERERAHVEALEAEAAKRIADAKEAHRNAVSVYRAACKKAGKEVEGDARGRAPNVSERVSFEVEVQGNQVRIAVRGRPETEERFPIEAVRASPGKTAAAFTERHVGPKDVVGNKQGTLSNKLRAVLGANAAR